MSADDHAPTHPEEPAPTAGRRALRTVVTLTLLAGALLFGQALRDQLGLEWSAESIQQTVGEAGLWAPVLYLALTAGRQLVLLPSVLVLTSAGLLFGAGPGALLGGLGITLNALVLYALARGTGRHWVQPWMQRKWPRFEGRARTAGPTLVALMTGHPTGVLTPFHLAAGITGMQLLIFVVAVMPAALFRAGLYSLLGASLLDVGSTGFWLATGGLVLCAVAPLLHPGLRQRLFGTNGQ